MAADARHLVSKDKRLPDSLAGDTLKVVRVKADESAYEHAAEGGVLVGEIKMWVLDTLPTGYLTCDGLEYNTAEYPALSALLGESSAGKFRTPSIVFPKNSEGIDTLAEEAATVGTHGHTANAVAAHSHTVSVTSAGNHVHSIARSGYPFSPGAGVIAHYPAEVIQGYQASEAAGAHTHTGSSAAAGGHTPMIANHTGVNQPACTLLHFIIKT